MKHETLTFRFLDMSRGGFARLFLLLLLPCLSVIGVKAADSNGGVKVTFNPAVRYSQWAINSRANDFYANTKPFGLATYNADGTPNKQRKDTKNKLDYVPGLVAKSMIEAADYYQGFDWSKPWFLSVKEYGDAYDTLIPEDGTSFDDLNGTKIYIGINSNNYASADDKKMVTTALASVKQGFIKANKTYIIPQGTLAENAGKNVAGGWWHKSTYENQMWLDGAYMGSALLAQLTQFYGNSGNVFGSKEADWNMVTKQLNIVWDMCWNSDDKLMYHAFDATATAKAADNGTATWYGLSSTKPYNFHSAAYWGRANAWYLYALVDVLEAMEADGQKGTTNYTTLKDHLDKLAAGIAARQDANNTGGWFQLLNKDGKFVSQQYNGTTKNDANYIETSATALFSAALFKAVRLGLLSTSPYDYKTVAAKAFEGLVNNFVTYDADGGIQIWGSCKSAGLSGKNYRDGSNEYYLSGSDVTMVKKGETTEGKVLGGFIMAATEYERAYQNQDSKQILFAKDLAPSYDFTTTEGKLDATAYGDGTITYQWYKDGNAIANAKSATYAPTENGNYYCVATANDKTITTSTTKVTAKSNSNTDNGSTDNNGGSENGETTTIFSLSVNTGANASVAQKSELSLAGYATITGGSAFVYNGKGSAKNMIVNGSITYTDKSEQYVKITLDKALAKGDVITIVTSGSNIYATKDNSSNTTNNIAKSPYTVDDNLAGATVLYLSSEDNGKTISSITITRPVKKYTVSATAGEGGSVSIKNGSGTTVNSGSEVEENTSLTFTATPSEGYEFVNWTDASNTAVVSTEATYTTTVTAAISLTANFMAKTPVTPTEDVIYNWNTIGSQKENIAVTEGTKNINGTSVPCINFGSNYNASRYTYMSIKDKDNGGFKAGDIITITGLYTGNKTTGIGMEIHTTRDGKAVFSTPYYNKELQTYTYTLTEDCDSLFFGRYGGATPNVTELKVVRPAASAKQRLSANFDTNNIKVVTGTMSITLPNLTVKAGSTELTATSDYSVSYESDANEIATLNGTQVNFVSGKTGLVTITAKVTPKDATKYEGTEAYYQILIQDPTPLNISVTDIDMNATDAEIKEPVVKVYGENDQLLKLGTDYTLSYSVSNGGPVSFPDGKLTVAGNKYNWTEGVSTITVTATPTENLSKKYKEGSVDFTYAVTKGLITPKFLDVFSGTNIKLAVKSGDKNNCNTFTVPLIYDGEDVSSYFDYTYEITSTSTANQQSVNGNKLTYYPKNAGTYTVTVSASVKTNKDNPALDYSDVYNNPTSITFTLDVNANYIRPVVKLNPVCVNMYTGTREDAPDVTITDYNTGKVIDESSYKVSWTTFTPGICKVDANGNIEAVSEGDGEVRVTVTGDNMESTTAFLKVLVDDPAMFRVKGTGTYGNQTRMWNQDKTLSVVLGGWMFPNPVATNGPESSPQQGPSTEGLSADFHWGTDKNLSSLPKWKLTGFDYYVVGNKNRNARQENGSNALPETTNIYSADFKSYTGTIKDKMFNVPCSGSFLEFNPATNGKVTVHIFQNGAFDSGVYRPQRRVFVMDEAGNFVESEAHIETTSGKPTGGIQPISSYKWDLNPDGKDTAPTTIVQVRSHFKGIPDTFDMTANAFKNDVYESLLSNDLVPNAAAGKGNGSLGWSVLADSPVTYTFNVKAGKTYYLYNFGSKIGFYGFSFDEGETKPTVDKPIFNDNETNTITATEDGHVAMVTVNRKMTKGIWTTCVLPFSLNRQQVDAIFGPAYSAAYPQGTQILYFDRVEGNKVYFVRHAYNTIVAGKPFLIKPTKEVTSINTAEVTDYPYVTIENTEPADWCTGNGYTWASSYNGMTVQEGDGFISNQDGTFKNFVGESGTLKGFRGYLKRLGTQTGAKPIMLQVVNSSNVDGDNGETTGIEDLIIDADGQLMPANGKVYNINGQLVSEDANSFQSLPSGIYIINGKKYIK